MQFESYNAVFKRGWDHGYFLSTFIRSPYIFEFETTTIQLSFIKDAPKK